MPRVCQKAQANLAKVRETDSTWEFHISRIDIWGYLAAGRGGEGRLMRYRRRWRCIGGRRQWMAWV